MKSPQTIHVYSPSYLLAMLALFALLLMAMGFSLAIGAVDIRATTVWHAITTPSEEFKELIVRTVRLPRMLSGAVIGMALAVAGALMQGLTRNPLASPGILGINAGAAFAVVCALVFLGSPPLLTFALFAALGAGLSAVFVYLLASMGTGGATPMKLTLAGAIFTAFLSAITTAILIFDEETLDQVRFWTAGSLAGRDFLILANTAPYIFVGLFIAVMLGKHITTLSLGDDVASGLGQNTKRIKQFAFIAVILTAGGATALAGPVGFVGLIVPHITRFLVGTDYRRILPASALLGAIIVTFADMLARFLIRPQELPVGIVMGLIGAPFFIYLARKKL